MPRRATASTALQVVKKVKPSPGSAHRLRWCDRRRAARWAAGARRAGTDHRRGPARDRGGPPAAWRRRELTTPPPPGPSGPRNGPDPAAARLRPADFGPTPPPPATKPPARRYRRTVARPVRRRRRAWPAGSGSTVAPPGAGSTRGPWSVPLAVLLVLLGVFATGAGLGRTVGPLDWTDTPSQRPAAGARNEPPTRQPAGQSTGPAHRPGDQGGRPGGPGRSGPGRLDRRPTVGPAPRDRLVRPGPDPR